MQEIQTLCKREIPKVDTPARLVVAATSEQRIDRIIDILVAAGFDRDQALTGGRLPGLVELPAGLDLTNVGEWLQANQDAHLLLLFNAPVPWIAQEIKRGASPAEALKKWQLGAKKVLSLVRRCRRRLSLLPLEGPLANPAAFLQALVERFGVAIQAPQFINQTLETPGPLFRMMAGNVVWESSEARHLAAELEANAIPIPPVHELMLPSVDEAYREFTTTIERTRARKEEFKAELEKIRQRLQAQEQDKVLQQERVQELEEENELLLKQLHQVQEELESQFQESREVRQMLDETKRAHQSAATDEEHGELRKQLDKKALEIKTLHEGKAKTEARIKDLEEENELLLQQLHHVQEELESYFLSGTDARQELEEARATIEALCNSKSWKITRPLRWFLEAFMGAEKAVR